MNHSPVPIKEFRLDLSDLTFTGHDLVRPESIIARPDGTLLVSDGRGGITRIEPDGGQQFIGGLGGEPNGLALLDDGSILLIHPRPYRLGAFRASSCSNGLPVLLQSFLPA